MKNPVIGAAAPAALTSFNFTTQAVRVVLDEHGNPWFIAADVALVLDYRMASDMTRFLDEDERGTHSVRTPSGEQEMLVINESGLYSAILKSRKPEAKRFKRWVTNEVLPAIRQTGRYVAPAAVETINRRQLHQLSQRVYCIASVFHMRNVAEWACWKTLSNHFQLTGGVTKLPAQHFEAALQMLEQLEGRAEAYRGARVDLEKKFFQRDFGHLPADLLLQDMSFNCDCNS